MKLADRPERNGTPSRFFDSPAHQPGVTPLEKLLLEHDAATRRYHRSTRIVRLFDRLNAVMAVLGYVAVVALLILLLESLLTSSPPSR